MSASQVVYEDEWGEVIDRPGASVLEIRWFDTTRQMTGEQFKQWLCVFAEKTEQTRRPGCLVDATSFRMPPTNQDMGWRDENIIPRYNAAGVKRFAFHMPEGMPLIGKPPQREGPADFPTGYFASRTDALAWLNE